MRFRTNTGSQPNASGLAQIAPGSRSIPQSFLNGIGRVVDKATVRVGGASVPFQQMAGGFVFEIPDASSSSTPDTYLHPFKVIYAGQANGGFLCQILEGRVAGRADFAYAGFTGTTVTPKTVVVGSIGTPGLDASYAGGWPGGTTKPDLGKTEDNAASEGSQTVEGDAESGSTTHTVSNVGKPYVSGSAGSLNGPYISGNAGSVTQPGNGGTYHTPIPVSGNGNYVSGNAGSITSPGQTSGTYHSPLPINGNQTFIGGPGTRNTITLTPNQANTTIMTDKPFTIDL